MTADTISRDRIREKLRRLLSMTVENGASETEAMAAAEAAARLMAEHNLSYRTVEEIDADGFATDTRPWFRGSGGFGRAAPVPAVKRCLPAICLLCGVEHAWSIYDGTLIFFGAPGDTEVAHYLTVIIARAMDREWAEYRRNLRNGQAPRLRASFYLGISSRIAMRLKDMAASPSTPVAGGTNLVVVKNALVKERFAAEMDTHGGVKNARKESARVGDSSALISGWSAGERVALNKGLNEATGARELAYAPKGGLCDE